ncbi:MAG TPA: DoxX family membrane protein [Gemmatimonadales bacterium]|nr:DoxX family membrane protein [Gemmatimonadales bacterium]
MDRSLRAGSAVFAVAMGAMGVLMLARPEVQHALEPLPKWLPGRSLVAGLSGALLIASAVTILIDRRARSGAVAIAGLLSFGMLLDIRLVFRNPGTPAWAVAFEAVVLGSAAWTLAGMLGFPQRLRVAARCGFGVSLLAFGLFHFVYHGYIESVVPAWIPGHTFWTYSIGCALIAAGLAILTGIKARLAATLLAIMFGSWVIILHAPRLAAAGLTSVNEWSSLLIALACCGASWIMRESLTPTA